MPSASAAAASASIPVCSAARHRRLRSPETSADGQQHEGLRAGREIAYLAQESVPEPLAHRKRLGQRCPAGELVGRVLGAELHERERVIVGVGQDAVGDLGVERTVDDRAEQLAGLGVGQALHRDDRKLLEHLRR